MEPDLDELRSRLRAAQEAAEQVAGAVPRQGWAQAEERDDAAEEVRGLIAIVGALRELVPAELRDQVREVLRQLVLLLRAILDLVVERLSHEPGHGPQAARAPAVQDIPIS
jgi:hypothetical protein